MANEWDGGAGAAEDLTPWRAPGRAAGRRRAAVPPPRQRHVARLFGWFVALGLLVSVALVAPVAPLSALQGPGGVLTVIGQVAAMAGTFLMLVALLLIARIPALEGALGQDRLVRWHGRLGPLVLGLIVTHVVAVTLGYAQQVRAGVLHEVGTLVLTFPGMLMAAASFGLLLLVALTSYRAARRRMRYETWWAVHLYTYLAAALSFPTSSGPARRSWTAQRRAPTGSLCGSSPPAPSSATAGSCPCCGPCATASASRRSSPKRQASCRS